MEFSFAPQIEIFLPQNVILFFEGGMHGILLRPKTEFHFTPKCNLVGREDGASLFA